MSHSISIAEESKFFEHLSRQSITTKAVHEMDNQEWIVFN